MALRIAYQEQLRTLQDELTEMGSLCVQAVQLAVQAMTTGNETLAGETREANEVVERKEREIETLCLKLLLQQQPVAADLRRISSALKMIYDLKRIGDQAADIAEISEYVVIQTGSAAEDLRKMAEEVVKMVQGSISAFISNDLAAAREVMAWDDTVDEWFTRITDDLVRAISSGHPQGKYCLDTLMAAKYLERIGDHACNVAGWVEYSILGYHSSQPGAGKTKSPAGGERTPG